MSKMIPAGIVTAYGAAVRGGYLGTYDEFCTALGDLARVLEEFEDFSVTVETLEPGESATADYSDGVLTLGIPAGETGNGIQSAVLNQDYTLTLTWTNGESTTVGPIRGTTGQTPNLTIGTVETLDPDASATATITGTPENPVLNLGIPKGDPGQDGASDAGDVTYDPEEDYDDGTVGKALKDELNAIDEIHETIGQRILEAEIGENQYYDSDGNIVPNNSWETVVCEVAGLNQVMYSGIRTAGNAPYSVWLDSTKSYISGSAFKQQTGENYLNVPSGASYVGFSVNYSDANNFAVIGLTGGGLAEEIADLSNAIDGNPTSKSTTTVSSLNFAENATKYTSGGSYGTFYIAVQKGQDLLYELENTSSSPFEARFSTSTLVPAGNVAGQYIGKATASQHSTESFEHTAQSDGYFSISYYVEAGRSFTLTIYENGIKQKVIHIEDELGTVSAKVEEQENTIHGISEELEMVIVNAVNFTENATKYISSNTNYNVAYIEVETGNDYNLTIKNTNSNAMEARFAFSTSIPAANVSGEYLGKKTANKNTEETFKYTATSTGYIGVAWYMESGKSCSAMEISGGFEQRINACEARIVNLESLSGEIEDVVEDIETINGKGVALESGIYWGATTVGTSLESQIQTSTSNVAERTMLTLPANRVLRISGAGVSDLTRLYWVFDATTGLLLDIVDSQDQLKLRAYYLRYDVETHIYINCNKSYAHYIRIVENEDPLVDLSKCVGQTYGRIIDNCGERDIRYAIRNMKRKARGCNYAPVMFLHFSDVHGDTENLKRLMEFASDYHIAHYLEDILCTGDIVKSTLDDGMTWFDSVDGTEKILLLPGNHDSVKGTAANPTAASKQEMYEALFSGRVSEWNVTQPEGAASSYLGYYYKDYATQKLRLICLDANGSGDYQTDEINWFADKLEEAYNLGYSVICAEHFAFSPEVCTGVHCTFNSDEAIENEGTWTIPNGYINAVETFIGGGGEFVCWIGGHVHKDRLTIHNNGHQMFVGVSTASHESHQIQYEDSERIYGDKSQDSFNIVAVDTYKKRLNILKIGSDLTRTLAHKRYLSIDYANRTVVWND